MSQELYRGNPARSLKLIETLLTLSPARKKLLKHRAQSTEHRAQSTEHINRKEHGMNPKKATTLQLPYPLITRLQHSNTRDHLATENLYSAAASLN